MAESHWCSVTACLSVGPVCRDNRGLFISLSSITSAAFWRLLLGLLPSSLSLSRRRRQQFVVCQQVFIINSVGCIYATWSPSGQILMLFIWPPKKWVLLFWFLPFKYDFCVFWRHRCWRCIKPYPFVGRANTLSLFSLWLDRWESLKLTTQAAWTLEDPCGGGCVVYSVRLSSCPRLISLTVSWQRSSIFLCYCNISDISSLSHRTQTCENMWGAFEETNVSPLVDCYFSFWLMFPHFFPGCSCHFVQFHVIAGIRHCCSNHWCLGSSPN